MKRRRHRWSVAALALTLLFALSGCVKLDMDMNIRADNTVDGTVIIAVDKQVLTAAGRSEQELLKQLDSQGPLAGANKPRQGSVAQKPYNQDGKIGQVYTFKDVSLSEFAGGEDGLSITRKGDRFYVTGVVDMTTDAPTDPQEKAIAEQYGKSAETRIKMTFPGEVLKSNGKIDGRSVTWRPKIGEKTMITAEARDSAIIPILLAGVGGAAVLLIIIALIIFLLVRRRRRRYPVTYDPEPPYQSPPPGYLQQPPYQQQPPPYQHQPPYQPPASGYPQPPAGPPGRPADATQPLPRVDPSPPWPPGR